VARLKKADGEIRTGNWQKAKKLSNNLLGEMGSRIQDGPGAERLLAMGLLFRALAQSGLGEAEAAEWDWFAAQALYPPIGDSDLTVYGKAGEGLQPVRASADQQPAEQAEKIRHCEPEDPGEEPCQGVTRPEKLSGRSPDYPQAVSAACLEGHVILEAIIDERGMVSKPHLLESPGGPLMSFAALEAVRHWKFKPAMLNGQPVKVYYSLTVNYMMENCR
jgi:TonB family protein